ncbi:unnamed protein product [Absidia cylindrospora]
MKFLFATSACILVLSLALTCSAICDCEAQDQECVQKCVIEANSCITSSKGETSYEDCIDDKWPSGDMFHKQDVPARPSNSDGKESGSTIASGTSSPGKATHSSGSPSPTGMMGSSGSPYKASETNVNNNNKNMSSSSSGATTHLLALNEMMTVIGLMMVATVGTWVHG